MSSLYLPRGVAEKVSAFPLKKIILISSKVFGILPSYALQRQQQCLYQGLTSQKLDMLLLQTWQKWHGEVSSSGEGGVWILRRQRGDGPLPVEEFLFLKKGHAAIGLALISETTKAACSPFPVVLWYVSGTGSRASLNGAPNKWRPS